MARSKLAQRHTDLPWMDPLEACRRLRSAGLRPMLLLSAGQHPEARRSFIGLTPHVEVRVEGRSIEERWADGAIEVLEADPVEYLRAMTERFHFDVEVEDGFTGGWMGLFGFGFANALEPSLPSPPARTDLPDVVLRLCLDALVFDAGAQRLTWHGADLEGAPDLEQRQNALVAALAKPLAASTPPPPATSKAASTVADAAAKIAAPATSKPIPATGNWTPSFAREGFESAAQHLRDLVQDGDLFQANLAVRWRTPGSPDPIDLLHALREANPAPYMALLELEGTTIVSGSPEQLFAVENGRIRSRPIAGTRKRGATAHEDAAMELELRTDRKEQAEHTMLVDLVRNDLARVAVPGTVAVPEYFGVERYRHVMHLVSRVEARVRHDTTFMDWMAALFPGGTVTGAPKVRATQRILEAEPVARGAYTGSAGYLGWNHDAHWSILIRGLQLHDGVVDVHAGAGIVADSDPAREWRESQRKAQALLDVATGATIPGSPGRLGETSASQAWSPPRASTSHSDARVLLIDNYDSFVHNLADYCAALGATVRVVRNDADWRAAAAQLDATHVVLSPGPGWPQEAGCTLEAAAELAGRIPVLGVCLGHQALGHLAGGIVRVHPRGPVHGSPDLVHHAGAGLFGGLPSPLRAARYHSLVVERMPPPWVVDATLEDGTVMAIRHPAKALFGVQFHPESIATEHGLTLLDAFLKVRSPSAPHPTQLEPARSP